MISKVSTLQGCNSHWFATGEHPYWPKPCPVNPGGHEQTTVPDIYSHLADG